MTYKQIEASREARLWIGQIIVPTITTIGALMMVPEIRYSVKEKAEEIKYKIHRIKK